MSPKKPRSSSDQQIKKTEGDIIGKAYEQLKSITKRYAENKLPVLFVGETGTGKELFAKYYVQSSPRNKNIFIAVNCAGFPDTLLEAEIFGHEKGTFTGAIERRIGKLEVCHGGILFLDEIGDASEKFQAAILRALENKGFFRIGGYQEIKVDVLIIAATNKPQTLRDDLKYRFHILTVPPLQEMDIPILTEFFLKKPLKKEILNALVAREFPGNVRELKRHCEKLKAEKGDAIFSDKKIRTIADNFFFDYERYMQELETWGKYIQPIIAKHKLIDFKYKYQPWDDNWADIESKDRDITKLMPALSLTHGPQEYDRDTSWLRERYAYPMLDLVEYLIKGFDEEHKVPVAKGKPEISPEKILPEFRRHLIEYFESKTLPYLLKKLYIKNESIDTSIIKPALTPLLDLPLEKAKNEFIKFYLQYHIQKNSMADTAKALGTKKKYLKQKLNRIDKTLVKPQK